MAQRLRELTAALEVLSSIPSNHMMAHIIRSGAQNTIYIINKFYKSLQKNMYSLG